MSIVISNMSIPPGCQKCKFFKKHPFGNGLDYSYSCILGAKDFPMPWIRQMEERASDCPIEPLEQEPCEDAISRQAAIDGLNSINGTSELDKAFEVIENLPPANPQPKTGHWIYDNIANNWRCDKCGETPKTMGYVGTADFMSEHFRFCNHCGAKMIEPQESEGEE